MFLVNSRPGLFTAAFESRTSEGTRTKAPLIPKLRGNFAEFLYNGYLERLRILSSPTCVSLWYGHQRLLTGAFLGDRIHRTQVNPLGPCLLGPAASCGLVIQSVFVSHRWRRNINLLSIDYAFRPRLRIRLTLGGITFPRKPQVFGEGASHSHSRYSYRHNHLHEVQCSSRYTFNPHATLPYHHHARRHDDP